MEVDFPKTPRGGEKREEIFQVHSQELFQFHLPLLVLYFQLVIIRTQLLLFQLQFLIQTEIEGKSNTLHRSLQFRGTQLKTRLQPH